MHQTVIVRPRHQNIHIVIPRDEFLIFHRAEERSVRQEKSDAVLPANVRQMPQDTQLQQLNLPQIRDLRHLFAPFISANSPLFFQI